MIQCPRPHCGGQIMAGACLLCGDRPRDAVTLSEALQILAESDALPHCGPRQAVPLAISLERARRWGRGEAAE